MPGLRALAAKGAANGVDDLKLISAEEAKKLEPALACVGAILSPSTGIFDSHAYFLALQGDAEAAGASFAFKTPFLSARVEDDGILVEAGGAEPMRLKTASAGQLRRPLRLARRARIAGLDPAKNPGNALRQGQLFHPAGPRAVFAADLSHADETRGRLAPHF